MKKYLFVMICMMLGMSVIAQQKIQLRSADRAECVKSDMTSLKASFSFSTIEAQDYESERGTFSWLSLPNTVIGGNVGDPQIPVVNELIAVPVGSNPYIEITSYSTTEYRLEDYGIRTLVPRQPSLRKDKKPEDVPFVYNEAAYQTRGLRNEPTAVVEVVGTMRGVQLGKMTIEPVSYDPVSNTIRVFNDIEVEVHFDGADARATEDLLVKTYSPYFDIVYKQLFNDRALRDIYSQHPDLYTTPVKMLVVTTSTYANSTAFQNWLTWKKQKGIDVDVQTVANSASASTIKNLIYSRYNANHPSFLVLVGDETVVTYYSLWDYDSTYGNAATDLEYASVDGDVYHDMFLSRMPVSSTTELNNLVNKILTYEKYTMSDPSYLSETLLIAGWDSSATAYIGKPTIQYANNYYFNTAHGITPHVFLTTASGQTTCYNYINNVGFVNYTAHGDIQKWHDPEFTNSNVNSLTNNDKYFWAMGNCCLTANFKNANNNQTCFGETMVRAANKGAWGYIGSVPESYWYEDYYFGVGATNTFGQMPTQAQTTTGVYDAMFDDTGFNTLNAVPFIGNVAVSYAHANSYTSSVTDEYYWRAYQCFGDGSVMPYHTVPAANNVSHNDVLPLGASSFTVSADAGSYVSITVDNEIIGVAQVPSNGTIAVPITAQNTAGTAMIVVTRNQRQPYITTVQMVGGVQYTITANVNPANAGTVTGAGLQYENTTCTLTAVANSGYDFVNWSDGNTQNPRSFNVTGDATFTANFTTVPLRNITLASVMNGTISCDHATAYKNDIITLTATPASGYNLDHWDVFKTDDMNTTVTVSGNTFTMPDYNVTVSAVFSKPTGGDVTIGSGTSTNKYIPTYAYYNYTLSQQIYKPSEVGSAGTITKVAFKVSNSKAAERTIDIYMSYTTKSSFSSSTDWVSQSTSNRVFSGSVNFNASDWTTITLNTPFEYNGTSNLLLTIDDNTGTWISGSGGSNAPQFYVYSTNGYTAIYAYDDNNNFNPSSPSSSNASGNNYLQTNNQVVFTKVVPNTEGSISVSPTSLTDFVSYIGVEASAPQSIAVIGDNLQSNLTVTAPNGYEVSTTDNGNYNNTLSLTPSSGNVRTNVYVRLKSDVTPGEHHGNLTLTSGSTTATVSLSGTAIGDVGEEYNVTVTASPEEGGTVTGAGTYYESFGCTLTATPNAHYSFGGWQLDGNIISNENPYTFTVTGDVAYTAIFNEGVYYNITISQSDGGIVNTSASTADPGEVVAITTTPDEDYSLNCLVVYKTGDVNTTVTVTDNSFIMPDYDVTVCAVFTMSQSNDITIGSGSSTSTDLPSNVWYKYATSQQIYTSEEFGDAGTITAIGFKYNGDDTSGERTFDIYMTHTSSSTLSSWVAVNADSKVYTGTKTFTSEEWYIIPLDTPFEYNGTDNVIITFDDNTGNYEGSNGRAFYTYSTDSNRAIYYRNDYNNQNPLNPTSSYSATQIQSNNQLMLTKVVQGGSALAISSENLVEFTYLDGESTSQVQTITVVGCVGDDIIVTAPEHYEVSDTPEGPFSNTLTIPITRNRTRETLTWDFEGSFEDWTTIDADGDGHNWELASVMMANYSHAGHSGDDMLTSESYYKDEDDSSNNTALTPDNWLVSPQVTLGGTFTMWAKAQDANWASEHFGIFVSTTSNTNTSSFTMLNEWTLTAKGTGGKSGVTRGGNRETGEWYDYSVDLSAYAGETGYIAVRHFNCTDMFYIDVDDFTLEYDEPVTPDEPGVQPTTLEYVTANVYVRMKSNLEEGTYNEILTFSVSDIDYDVELNGEVTPQSMQVVTLQQGWNWVAFNVDITLDGLKEALVEALPNAAITIKSQTEKTTYNPTNHRWSGRINSWDLTRMYKISVSAACEITLEGNRVNSTENPITVNSGVNWISYPLNTSMNVTDAFNGFAINGDVIKSQTNKAQYTRNRWQGQFNTLEPGKGFIYNSNSTEDRPLVFGINKNKKEE
jgi:hypothetical protein